MENLIDFPVSDDWRDYYYEKGMTPFPSKNYFNKAKEAAKELHRETFKLQADTINQQNRKIQELQDTNKALYKKLDRIEKKLFGSSSSSGKEGGEWRLKSDEWQENTHLQND